ncbi:SLAP domain-containing protein [Lactobacillus apis]|uniref:SLAP domain-containing protein n=1 Tax=Lactobacillus apis TaxID=303541 RepID=UPI002430A926|nr:SLAP domain-containing protein [Lactobacillus apis]
MKLSHKLMVVSAAALIGVSPVLSASQTAVVQAAHKSTAKKTSSTKKNASKKGTIKLSHNSYVYDKDGKRLKTYMGSEKNTTIGKGYTLKYASKVTIGGIEFYDIGGGAFVKAANVGYVDGKKVTKANATTATASAKIKHNAYIYDAKGKTDKKKIKKGQTVTFDQAIYIGKKLYYRISGQTNQFIKAANVGKLAGATLKPVNESITPSDNQNDPTVITLNHNAYIYDDQGNASKTLLKKGQQIQVDKLQYIDGKLYYRISDSKYPGENQWVKKSNVGVITGKQLKPANEKPTDDQDATFATIARDTNVYDEKGIAQPTKTFAKGHVARVNELRYIWVQSESKAVLFYKLQSDKNGFIKEDDVNIISGHKLTPVNTPEIAKNQAITATDADKKSLQDALGEAAAVKAGDAYKLSAKALRDSYDAAIATGTQVNTAISTVAQVNDTLSKITTAKNALNGKKIPVNDLNNLTITEADQIVQLAATANGVDKSAIQFSNNNTILTITGANGFQQTLNITDYATANK